MGLELLCCHRHFLHRDLGHCQPLQWPFRGSIMPTMGPSTCHRAQFLLPSHAASRAHKSCKYSTSMGSGRVQCPQAIWSFSQARLTGSFLAQHFPILPCTRREQKGFILIQTFHYPHTCSVQGLLQLCLSLVVEKSVVPHCTSSVTAPELPLEIPVASPSLQGLVRLSGQVYLPHSLGFPIFCDFYLQVGALNFTHI